VVDKELISHDSWGDDLYVHLMAIGQQRDIISVSALHKGSSYARSCSSLPKMKGGIFNLLKTEDLYNHWKLWKPAPLLIIYIATTIMTLLRQLYNAI